MTTDANGGFSASALYKAFGETRYSSGNLGTDYKFTGQREEAALGIYFFNARWMDPSLGRFTSPDTIVPTGTQGTQAWDRYAFVNNNPVRYTDPTGHELSTWTKIGIGLAILGAIVALPAVLATAGVITLTATTVTYLGIAAGGLELAAVITASIGMVSDSNASDAQVASLEAENSLEERVILTQGAENATQDSQLSTQSAQISDLQTQVAPSATPTPSPTATSTLTPTPTSTATLTETPWLPSNTPLPCYDANGNAYYCQ